MRFPNGTEALAGVDLEVGAGEFLSLLGPSGCGKSTLLRLIAGLIRPSSGEVAFPGGARAPGGIGFVFQDATLMPWATALANARLPLRLRGMARGEAEERAAAALGGGRSRGLRAGLAARAFGGDADARLHRARLGDAPVACC